MFCCAVLEDLLWGFMGYEGKYIRANRARSSRGCVTFQLNGKLDHAVHELVVRMLPIWYAPAHASDTMLLLLLLLCRGNCPAQERGYLLSCTEAV